MTNRKKRPKVDALKSRMPGAYSHRVSVLLDSVRARARIRTAESFAWHLQLSFKERARVTCLQSEVEAE